MPTYKLITLEVATPFGGALPSNTVEDFVQMVNNAIEMGATPIGGISVVMRGADWAYPQYVYTQAVLY